MTIKSCEEIHISESISPPSRLHVCVNLLSWKTLPHVRIELKQYGTSDESLPALCLTSCDERLCQRLADPWQELSHNRTRLSAPTLCRLTFTTSPHTAEGDCVHLHVRTMRTIRLEEQTSLSVLLFTVNSSRIVVPGDDRLVWCRSDIIWSKFRRNDNSCGEMAASLNWTQPH